MKKTFLFLLFVVTFCMTANAQVDTAKVEEAPKAQKFINSDYRVIFNGVSPEEIYGMAFLTIYDGGQEQDFAMMKPNAKDLTFSASLRIPSTIKDSKNAFSANADFKVEGNSLVIKLDDISLTSKKVMVKWKKRIQNDVLSDNEKKNAQLREAEASINSYMQSLFEKIKGKKYVVSRKHWDNIIEGNIIKGMSMDECLLSRGKPGTVYKESKTKVQWGYGLYFTIYFSDGIATQVVK